MIYLSGAMVPESHPNVGMMTSPDIGNVLRADQWWAYDNACFNHSGDFEWDRWLRVLRLKQAQAPGKCLFVTAPDIPFDADGTRARFMEYRERLLALDVPLAFITQDGMGVEDIPWGDISAVFVGGSDEWKLGRESAAIMAEAKRRQKWVHVGRVNGYGRLRKAYILGADSVDGTYLRFGPKTNWPRVVHWLTKIHAMPPMRMAGRQ